MKPGPGARNILRIYRFEFYDILIFLSQFYQFFCYPLNNTLWGVVWNDTGKTILQLQSVSIWFLDRIQKGGANTKHASPIVEMFAIWNAKNDACTLNTFEIRVHWFAHHIVCLLKSNPLFFRFDERRKRTKSVTGTAEQYI